MLLVTTGIGAEHADADEVLLLGTWCRTYASKPQSAKAAAVLPYHWDDRDKLARDYSYLEDLHGRILVALSHELNELHAIQRDRRYWQTLLDPWLFDYLATMFDRWESISQVFRAHPQVTTYELVPDSVMRAPRDWPDFNDLATGDAWNHRVYLDILQRCYESHCDIRRESCGELRPVGVSGVRAPAAPQQPALARAIRTIIRGIWLRAEELLCDRNAVFFYNTFMPRKPFIGLNLRLGQWPRFRSCFVLADEPAAQAAAAARDDRRGALCKGVPPRSQFEEWLMARLGSDVPISCVETFDALRRHGDRVRARCKVIFTSNAHFTEAPFKVWCAEKVHDGCMLVVSEHGGSFPPLDELFDFEEKISDARATWFRPYDPRHVQLPATKLIGSIRRTDRARRVPSTGLCSAIAPDYPRYAYRAHYYPIAGQVETVHRMIIDLRDRLGPAAAKAFRVKPYPALDAYRDTLRWLERTIGTDNVITGRSLGEVFSVSRIVVCMYPETTFSEAMAFGVPVVLLYPAELYERHPITQPLLEVLKQARIVFHDAGEAAAHIDSIWDDPHAWWQREDVVAARKRFQREALGYDGAWLDPWLALFRDMISRADTRPLPRPV
jgi:putative transferase (TIGR04331 family)